MKVQLNKQESYIFLTRLCTNEILTMVNKDIILDSYFNDLFINVRKNIKMSELEKMQLTEFQSKLIELTNIKLEMKYDVNDLKNVLTKIRRSQY